MTNQPFKPTEEPITIGGKQYKVGLVVNGVPILEPLTKQPEAEKHQYEIKIYGFTSEDSVLEESYFWTPRQAQLVADAVWELLKYINGGASADDIVRSRNKARDAIKDSE